MYSFFQSASQPASLHDGAFIEIGGGASDEEDLVACAGGVPHFVDAGLEQVHALVVKLAVAAWRQSGDKGAADKRDSHQISESWELRRYSNAPDLVAVTFLRLLVTVATV